jgi:hypothetical protein
MTSLRLSLPIDRPRVWDYCLEGDVWKKIAYTLTSLFIASVALNTIEVFTGFFSVPYAGVESPYHLSKAELLRNMEFMRARDRMFRRMYGKEAAWTQERQNEYVQLTSLKNEYERRYAAHIQTAQAVALPQLPDVIRTARTAQRPVPRNTMPEGVVAPVPGRREDQNQSYSGNQ